MSNENTREIEDTKLDYWRGDEVDGISLANEDTIPRKIVPVFMKENKVTDLKISLNRPPYEKILLCPHCLNAYYAGNYQEDNSLIFEPDDHIKSNYIGIASEEEYYNHIQNCKQPFKTDGIKRVTANAKKQVKHIVHRLSGWATCDTHFREILTSSDWFGTVNNMDGNISYLYIVNGLPVAFATFTEDCITIYEDGQPLVIDTYNIHDLFTFKEFRNRGYATQLIEHAIYDLDIPEGCLAAYYPLTVDSSRVMKNFPHKAV